jgi:flagellar protein FliS
MTHPASLNYFENTVLSASPAELVCLLYRGALDAVRQARHALAAGDIPARSRAINKACGIVLELVQALQAPEGAEELQENLRRLYDYLLQQLVKANAEQADAPLAEAERLLGTLLEGWSQLTSAD